MYCIIVGGGKVGSSLAQELLSDGHECLVIEKDRAKCERLNDEAGDITLQGDGCEAAVLETAGTARAGVFIAVTGGDEDNLVACQVARKKFDVPHTIARLNNPKNEVIFKAVGIDTTVSATSAILAYIDRELPTNHLVTVTSLRGGALLVSAQITESSPAAGKRVDQLALPSGTAVAIISRASGAQLVPEPSTELRAGDEVLAIATEAAEAALRTALIG